MCYKIMLDIAKIIPCSPLGMPTFKISIVSFLYKRIFLNLKSIKFLFFFKKMKTSIEAVQYENMLLNPVPTTDR